MSLVPLVVMPLVIGLIVVVGWNQVRHRATPGGPVATITDVMLSRRARWLIAGSIFFALGVMRLLT